LTRQLAPRLLVTGFEANDEGLNASQILVQSIAASVPEGLKNLGASLFTRILPGDTNALKAALESALDEYAPHLTLLCGQAPGRSKITLERVATNIRDFRIPDGAGNVECGSLIEASGPPAFFSNLGDIQCLADVLQNHESRRLRPITPATICAIRLFITRFAIMVKETMQCNSIHGLVSCTFQPCRSKLHKMVRPSYHAAKSVLVLEGPNCLNVRRYGWKPPL